jgi:hypothetical protein
MTTSPANDRLPAQLYNLEILAHEISEVVYSLKLNSEPGEQLGQRLLLRILQALSKVFVLRLQRLLSKLQLSYVRVKSSMAPRIAGLIYCSDFIS